MSTTELELAAILRAFQLRENQPDILKANWYIIGTAALAGAGAGKHVKQVYELAKAGVSSKNHIKIIQRRIKEAILKTSLLYGLPRTAWAIASLTEGIPEDERDHYNPR